MSTDFINNWLQEKINFLLSNKEIIIMILPVIWAFFVTWEYMYEKRYCKYLGIEKWYKKTFSLAFHPKYATSLLFSIMWLVIFYCIVDLTPIKPFFKNKPLLLIELFLIIIAILSYWVSCYFLTISKYFKRIEQSKKMVNVDALCEYRVYSRKVGKLYFKIIQLFFLIIAFLLAVVVLTYFENAFGLFSLIFIFIYYLFNDEYYCSFKKVGILFKVNYLNVIESDGNYYSIVLPIQSIDGKNNLIVRTSFCRGKAGLVTVYFDNSDCKYIDSISDIKISRFYFDQFRKITFENCTLTSIKEKEELMNEIYCINEEEKIYLNGKWIDIEGNQKDKLPNKKKRTKDK